MQKRRELRRTVKEHVAMACKATRKLGKQQERQTAVESFLQGVHDFDTETKSQEEEPKKKRFRGKHKMDRKVTQNERKEQLATFNSQMEAALSTLLQMQQEDGESVGFTWMVRINKSTTPGIGPG